MPVDKLTIEQFAQKVKAKYPQYKDINDSVLVDKMVNKYPEYKTRINYSPAPEQESFKPLSDWLSIPQAAQPMVQENVVNDHNTKVAQSKERVNAHLLDVDNSITNLIHDRKKDIQGRMVSEQLGINPKELGPVNPQAQVLESKMRQDIPVTPEEVQSFKNRMSVDVGTARMALNQKAKDLSEKDPVASKQLKADVYRLDRQNDPSKDNKITENTDKIISGEYDYDINHGQLVKPEGFFGSLVTGFKDKRDAFKDYDVYKTGDKNAILQRIKERTKYDPDKAIPVSEEGWLNKPLAEMARGLGGQPLKPLIGGGVSGWLLGPEAGVAASAAISAPEMYKLTFGSMLPHNYESLKKENPNMSEEDVLQKAIDLTHKQANTDAFTGAAMGALGAKVGFAPTGLKNGLLQKSLGSALKQIGQEGVKRTIEGLGVGAVGAGGQIVKNIMAQNAGVKTDVDEGVAQQLWGGVGMTMAMTLIAKTPELLKPKTYNQLLQSIKNVPKEEIKAHLDNLEQVGQITSDQSQAAQKAIEEHQALDNSIKPNVPEADRLKVQGLIKKRNELDASLEVEDKAYHADTKEKIKSLNEQINDVSKGADRGELQQLVDQEHKAGNLQDFTAQVLRDASENDLKGYLKEISEQVAGGNEESAIQSFGENIVNKAKELYPKETPKESKISVIQPREIKQPETITIKPKDNRIEVVHAGPEAIMDIDESRLQSRDNGEYGKGFYVSRSELESPFYGKVKSRFVINENSKILNEKSFDVDDYKRYEVQKNGYDYEKVKQHPEQYGDFEPLLKLNSFEDAVKFDRKGLNDYARKRGYDIYEPTNNEMVVLNLKSIKPKENAIPIESSNEMDVPQTPRNGEEMGSGNTQSEIVAGSQEGQPKEEGNVAGKEGVEHPTVVPGAKNVYAERPPTQLSFRGLQDTANEFGYEDVVSRDRKTDLQTRSNAEKTANEWASKGEYRENVDELWRKVDEKEMVPTDEQRLILEQDLANQKQILRDTPKSTPEYDTQFAKVKRLKEIGNRARSEAGAALRLPEGGSRPHPINDEVDAMVAKAEANGVDKLTDEQKTEVETQVEKYKKATDEANLKIQELESQVAKLDAQKEFNKIKSNTKKVKKTAEERLAFRRNEIEAAREALRKLRSGESGLSSVPLPGVRELIAIAPHVKNIMVDLVSQGVDNLQDVISHLHNEFKDVLDGVTEKNIHDIIAGEYNEPGRPLSELQRQVRDLQDEAKLINQIESLENGVEPKTEKAKRERNQKIKALRDKIKDLKKEDGADELRAIKKRNEEQEKKIKEKIAKGEFEKETKKSIFDREDVKQKHPELRKQALDAIAAKEEAQHEFDLALFNDEMSKSKWYQKGGRTIAKIIHTSKAIMSGIDDSATFVQNGLAMLANPKIGAKAWLNHAKDAFSNARFKRELAALHQRPDWDIIKNSGLEIVEPHSAASKQVEEAFEQNLLAQLEIKGIKPWDYTGGIFERAFTSMGNNMRLLLFEKQMAALKDAGMTFESHPKEYKDAARVINELTGRGKLPQGLAQASPYITPFIWAPRMLASTLNTLGIGEVMGLKGKGYYQNLTPMQRKFALSQLGRGVGIGVAVMGAAALGGAKVDYDPRSVTFGDVIIGDHHYNVFGRYTPVVKVLVQAASGKRIKGGGEEQDLDSGKFGAKNRADVVYGFFRGKTTPALGTALNLAEGRNYFTNQPFTIKDVPGSLLQPMSIKELRDGWKNDGSLTILNRFLPAFEGMKTSDERDFSKKGGSGGGAGATGHISTTQKKMTKTKHISHKHN